MQSFRERVEEFARAYNDVATNPNLAAVAERLGVTVKTVKNRAAEIRGRRQNGEDVPELVSRAGRAAQPVDFSKREVEFGELPDPDEDVNSLLARAIEHNERQQHYHEAKRVVDVRVKTPGPIGIAGIPDQHLNNPGTRLRKAFDDARLIAETPGLYGVSIGDSLDNFIIGRLERARRKDVMSHSDSWRLQEHYFSIIAEKLLISIGGNHNDWIEKLGGLDILKMQFRDLGIDATYHPVQQRVRVTTPNGNRFVHFARHGYPGKSKYHATHGILTWMLERWQGEDVFWGGHIHTSGYMMLQRDWMGEKRVVHGVQLSSYKKIDAYAIEGGFRECDTFTTPMVIHEENGTTTFHADIEEGVDILRYKRRKAGY